MRKRYNGTQIRSIKAINRFFPHIMPRRPDSVAFTDVRIEMDNALAYLKKVNEQRPDADRIKIFDLYLAAIHRLFLERPRLNRFIIGRTYYQRNEHLYFFVSKREINDDAEERTIGLNLGPRDDIVKVHKKARAEIRESKTGTEDTSDEKTVELLMKFPRWFVKGFASLMYRLDQSNLMPKSLAASDSLHGSAYIANLGSFGVKNPPFHHLYDWGDTSLFFCIGTLVKEAVVNQKSDEIEVKTIAPMRVTLDERIADGVYFNNCFEVFNDLFQHPEKLEVIPGDAKDPYPGVVFKTRKGGRKKHKA
ncbi:MAG: 2-oxo acid dehydrogenase subunit E2 [Candidatus Marinimicrobia bacterium]|nr:2-oxo acid dehydrogenase subunit E2 [Candidatus Neomarinimicrobiota bacterium]